MPRSCRRRRLAAVRLSDATVESARGYPDVLRQVGIVVIDLVAEAQFTVDGCGMSALDEGKAAARR